MKIRLIIILISFILFSCFENKQEKLFEFSKSDDLKELKKLFAKSTLKLDTIDDLGYSPLGYAVKNQNIEMVEYLIKKGASVNYYKNYYCSPLFLALTSKKNDTLIDNTGSTIYSKTEIVKNIASNGLIINKNNNDGKSFVKLMLEIKSNKLRELTFSKVIEDTLVLKQKQSNSDKYAEEFKQKVINYNKEKNIPLAKNTNQKKDKNSITFNLHNVKIANSLLSEIDYKKAVKQRDLYKIEYCNTQNYKLVPCHIHPFARAVQLSYDEHRPLIISPDIIWLLICQGFSKHIELNKTKYQGLLVNFNGIKKIDVVRNDFVKGKSDSLWSEVIKQFSKQVKSYVIDTSLHSRIVHSFSTTTEKELISFEIAFLEVNKQYFDYNFWACGIPKIILEGKTEDWIWIRNSIENFKDYDLAWWTNKLIPILDELVETSKGNVDLEFWSRIYRYDQNCNSDITGWFAKFFPYIRKGETKLEKNPLVLNEPIYHDMYFSGGIENENFVSGLSQVNFTFHDKNNVSYKMSFVSGFVGINQNHETKALKPEINWLVLNK